MKNITTVTASATSVKSEPAIDPFSELKSLIAAISIENDAGLLRAESSQAPFNSTRLLLTGRRELLDAVMAYINGDPSKLQAMVRP